MYLTITTIIFIILILIFINMYYRRWTRMHLKPGLRYYTKYGVMNP